MYGSNVLWTACPGPDVTFKSEHKYMDMLDYFTVKYPTEQFD